MKRTGVIIQARTGSSRLPGKVLLPLGDRSVLAHVLTRAGAIEGIDVVCCAIPEGGDDDPVAAEAARHGAVVFRGSEHDVLDRYYQAATALSLEVVMRVTADCPLIDPAVCAGVLRMWHDTGADYACNSMPPSWPHGLDCEVFAFGWLARAWREADRPWQREHVTPFIRAHAEAHRVNLAMPDSPRDADRWTLDHPRDLTFLRAVAARLPAGDVGWDFRTVLGIVDADPALLRLNDGYDRNEGLTRSMEAVA